MILKSIRMVAGAALVGVLALTGAPTASALGAPVPLQASQAPGYEHQVDVLFIEAPGIPFVDESVLEDAVERISDYWVTETEGRISKIAPREIQRARVPTEEPLASQVCSNDGAQVRQAAATRFNRSVQSYNQSNGEHLLIIESTTACGNPVSGNATLGNKGLQSGGSIWVKLNPNAPMRWNHVLFHEFGHNLGLQHSDELACTGGQIDTETINSQGVPSSPECTINEYHDAIDVMANRFEYQGYSKFEHVAALNVTHRIGLGVFGDSDITRVSQDDGTAQFVPLQPSTDVSGIRAVEITDPVTGEKYYLEYRAGQGRDAESYYASWPEEFSHVRELKPGVRVLRMHSRSGSAVLNRPGLSDEDAAKQGGNSYVTGDVFNGFSRQLRVEVMSMDAENAGLCIAFTDDEVPPVTAGSPSLSEGDTVGTVLTVDPGTWTPSSADLTYQWLRDGVEIPGVTGSTYELTEADLDSDISVRVEGSETCYVDQSAESAAVTVVQAVDEDGEDKDDPDPEPTEPGEEDPDTDTDSSTTEPGDDEETTQPETDRETTEEEQDETVLDDQVDEALPSGAEDIGSLPSTGYGSFAGIGVVTGALALLSGTLLLVLSRRRQG